jgi:glutathione reductase (NADPH)
LNGIYEKNLKNSNVDYYRGTGSFVSPRVVKTSEGVLLKADHIMIASGSYPAIAQIKGGEYCINSDHIFTMEELPKSMIVLGGGYIAIEMA